MATGDQAPPADLPDRIGHYELLRRLGSGGMGQVFLAEDTRLRRSVAIKILHPIPSWSPESGRTLLSEARIAATLDHPNICSVYEVGEHGSLPFIVMQYVPGELLRDRMHAGPLAPDEVLDLGIQIADALSEAHRHGVVHRDVKPANVMIHERGLVKVLDFGVAKATRSAGAGGDPTRAATVSGELVGTLSYMSPEQLNGEPADPRSDVFALAVILHEALSGRHPFEGPTPTATAARILTSDAAPISERVPSLSPDFADVISRGLSSDPAHRYADAGEMLADLRSVREGTGLRPSVARDGPARGAGKSRLTRRRLGVAAAVLAVAGAAALRLALASDPPPAGPRRMEAVAVLPLSNLTDDPGQDYLADGLTEGIINDLARLPGLKVMSRSAVFRYKNLDGDPRAIGEELDVPAVVTGRVRQSASGIEVSLELVDTERNVQVWGGRFTRARDDPEGVQKEISEALARQLGLDLEPEAVRSMVPVSGARGDAYEIYLQGSFHYNQFTGDGLQQAVRYFQEALAIAPDFALAHAGIARAYAMLANNFVPARTVVGPWQASAERALELDANLADGFYALASLDYRYRWDWASAEERFETAIRLNPNQADVRSTYGAMLAALGRFEESRAQLEQALRLDPLSILHNMTLAQNFMVSRAYERALERYDVTLAAAPRYLQALTTKARTYSLMNRHEEALETARRALEVAPGNALALAALSYVEVRAGMADEGRSHLERLLAEQEVLNVHSTTIAQIYGELRQTDLALDWLERAYQQRLAWLVLLKVDPMYDPLRSEPRFQALVEAMGFPE